MGVTGTINMEVRIAGAWHFVAWATLRRLADFYEQIGFTEPATHHPLQQSVPDASIGTKVRFSLAGGTCVKQIDLASFRELIHYHWKRAGEQLDTRPGFTSIERDWAQQMLSGDDDLILEDFLASWPDKDAAYGDAARVICWFN